MLFRNGPIQNPRDERDTHRKLKLRRPPSIKHRGSGGLFGLLLSTINKPYRSGIHRVETNRAQIKNLLATTRTHTSQRTHMNESGVSVRAVSAAVERNRIPPRYFDGRGPAPLWRAPCKCRKNAGLNGLACRPLPGVCRQYQCVAAARLKSCEIRALCGKAISTLRQNI
jgi:hypothetical protein